MFNSAVLDVVIGLVFIYLLYSLLATIIQEIIASSFAFRAKILQRAIFRMLEDKSNFNFSISSIFYLFKKTGNIGDAESTSFKFYDHPLVKFLGENNYHSKPGYIRKTTFSKVLIDLLRGNKVKPGEDIRPLIQKALYGNETTKLDNNQEDHHPDEAEVLSKKTPAVDAALSGRSNSGVIKIGNETLSYIRSIWVDSQGDIEKFKEYLENWFDETMERASSWYKRQTQFILFFIGLAIAIMFNVDTIKIVDKLEKDPKLRELLVQQADVFVKANPDLDMKYLAEKAEYDSLLSHNAKKGLALPDSMVMVTYKALIQKRAALIQRMDSLTKIDIQKANGILGIGLSSFECNSCCCFLKSLLGWIITALALSLGAPFWFDLLNKLMKLRNSVVSSSSDDTQKPQGSPTPAIKRVG